MPGPPGSDLHFAASLGRFASGAAMPSMPAPPVTVSSHRRRLGSRPGRRRPAGLTAQPQAAAAAVAVRPRRARALFEQITTLPEYYPTRAEREILTAYGPEIAARCGASTLIELGSGTSDKTVALIDALRDAGTLRRFVAFDVAEPTLRAAVATPGGGLPGPRGLRRGRRLRGAPRPPARGRGPPGRLPRRHHRQPHRRASGPASWPPWPTGCTPGEGLLLGVDLVKDPARLVAAYDDSAGVTADFEKNVLQVVNTALGANFDLDRFDYVARWDPVAEHISMGLRSRGRQTVDVAALGLARRARRRRGDRHRGQRQVPPGRHHRRARSGRIRADGLVDRCVR